MRKLGMLVVAGVLASVAGCTAPAVTPTQTSDTPTASASPTPTPTPTPTPSLPTLTPPRQFDTVHTVRLSPADQVRAGTLSGDDFFTLNGDSVWGINVHDGSVAFRTPLGDPGPVSCWSQAVDGAGVYTVTMSAPAESATPASLRVTAVDRGSGAVAWQFQAPSGALAAGADCTSTTSTLTVTGHGLLLALTQTDVATLGHPVTALSWMLDPATGHPLWQTATDVLATDGADFGVSVAPALLPAPSGVVGYQASPVNLASGEVGQPFWVTGQSMKMAARYQLAGRAGANLTLLAQNTIGAATTTTVYEVAAATGVATPQPVTQTQAVNLATCQLAGLDRLVCTATDDPTAVLGVSLTDGSTVWQHVFKAADVTTTPLLFGDYLYGYDPTRLVSYVLDTASGNLLQTAAYPPAIAVNEAGLVFTVPSSGNAPAWQCWWAPALA